MRAVQISEWGGPEVLRVVDLPVPVPAADEVLIEVSRAGLNYADTHRRRNSYVAKAELPLVPGAEVVGTRTDTGERVIALTGDGGYAEFATAPAALTFPVPEGVDDGTALALLLQGLTAHHVLATSAKLQPGETVVVHAAAGGVGSLAVQLAKPHGAGRVIASASSEEKRALAVGLGADATIDADPEGMRDRLIQANLGEPVDVVIEMAGGQTFDESLAALAPFGRLVVCGIASQEPNEVSSGKLLRRSAGVIGFWLFHCLAKPALVDEALADLFARVERGELRVVVGETYGLSDVARAHEDLQGRRTTGKLLLDPRS
jgi:NADPH:quinone reductase